MASNLPVKCSQKAEPRYAISQMCSEDPEPSNSFSEWAEGKPVIKQFYQSDMKSDLSPYCKASTIMLDGKCDGEFGYCMPTSNYYARVFQQNRWDSDSNESLATACLLGMGFNNQQNAKFCCGSKTCRTKNIQTTDLVRLGITNRDSKISCQGPYNTDGYPTTQSVTLATTNDTLGTAVNNKLQEYCTSANDKDGNNMGDPGCQQWCKQYGHGSQGKETPYAGWCDEAMRVYCKKKETDSPEICNCINSPVQRAGCFDPKCNNKDSYLTQAGWDTLNNCGNICQQIINVNKTGGNVNIDHNQFTQECGFQPISHYACKNKKCVLQDGGEFKNDSTCGGKCDPSTPYYPHDKSSTLDVIKKWFKTGYNLVYVLGAVGVLVLMLIIMIVIRIKMSQRITAISRN
jgi:hypothetical protein